MASNNALDMLAKCGLRDNIKPAANNNVTNNVTNNALDMLAKCGLRDNIKPATNSLRQKTEYDQRVDFGEQALLSGDYPRALKNFLDIEAECARADYFLGLMYAEGISVEQNAETAVSYWRSGEEKGDLLCKICLMEEDDFNDSYEDEDSEEVRIALYEADMDSFFGFQFAKKCDACSSALLVEADKIRYYEASAVRGNVLAMYELYESYKGNNNPDKAKVALEQAAERRYPKAMIQIGEFYEHGTEGYPQDLDKALMYYNMAKDAKYPPANSHLGKIYFSCGQYKSAFPYIKRAAKAGDDEAMLTLAEIYQNGLGTRQRPEEAQKWFEEAQKTSAAKANIVPNVTNTLAPPQQSVVDHAVSNELSSSITKEAMEEARKTLEAKATVVTNVTNTLAPPQQSVVEHAVSNESSSSIKKFYNRLHKKVSNESLRTITKEAVEQVQEQYLNLKAIYGAVPDNVQAEPVAQQKVNNENPYENHNVASDSITLEPEVQQADYEEEAFEEVNSAPEMIAAPANSLENIYTAQAASMKAEGLKQRDAAKQMLGMVMNGTVVQDWTFFPNINQADIATVNNNYAGVQLPFDVLAIYDDATINSPAFRGKSGIMLTSKKLITSQNFVVPFAMISSISIAKDTLEIVCDDNSSFKFYSNKNFSEEVLLANLIMALACTAKTYRS